MTVDLVLSNAKVYDVTRIEVAKGEHFQLIGDGPGRWLTENDPILDLGTIKNNTSDAFASEVGTSSIWIFNDSKQIIKELTVSVVDKIVPRATALNLSADASIPG